MFKLITKRLPWRGDAVAAGLEAGGKERGRRAAEFVLHRARSYAPVRTGRLAASIEVRSSMGGAAWHVVATAPYARFVEYGSMHGNTFIGPNPFMRRALSDGRREFPQLLKQALVTAKSGQHLGTSFRA